MSLELFRRLRLGGQDAVERHHGKNLRVAAQALSIVPRLQRRFCESQGRVCYENIFDGFLG